MKAYNEWAAPITSVPISYISWSGAFAIAAVLRRTCYIPELYLGPYNCYPHLFVKLIGPPGLGKTVSMNLAGRLLKHVPVLNKGPDLFTKEYLVKQIIEASGGAVYIMLGEFGELLQKNGPEVYDALISHFDTKDELVEGTRSRGAQSVTNPSLNFMSATTPKWIAQNMNDSITGGGYASRCIWVYEEKKRKPKLFHHLTVESAEAKQKEEDLIHDLNHMSQLAGEFHITGGSSWNATRPQLEKYGTDSGTDWMQDQHEKTDATKYDSTWMQNYAVRKTLMTMKLAMIFSVAERDDLVLTAADFERAQTALEKTENNLPKVFGGMGRNSYTVTMDDISTYVILQKSVPYSQLLRRFNAEAEPQMLQTLIEGLVKMEIIRHDIVDGGTVFYPGSAVS